MNNSKKKIIVLAGYAPTLLYFRGHMLTKFQELGYDVIACAPQNDPETADSLKKLGVPYRQMKMSVTGMNPIRDIQTVFYLKKLFNELQPSHIFAYTIKSVIYGSIGAALAGVPNIYSMITGLGYAFERDSLKQKITGLISKYLYKLALRFNKAVFFHNPDDIAQFKGTKILSKQTKIVRTYGSGVDLDYYSKQEFTTSSISFLLIARLIKDKGIFEYAEAARILKSKYPETEFRIVGFYYDNPNGISQEQMKTWQDEGIIQYLGPASDVRPSIKECSVYVLPSYREGTPRSVLEAMAVGRAIITTDVPGCRETVVPGKNGFLVPDRKSKELAEKMELFIKDPNLIIKMGNESRKIAEEKYDVHKVNELICHTMGLN